MKKKFEKLMIILSAICLLNQSSSYAKELIEENNLEEIEYYTETQAKEDNKDYYKNSVNDLINHIKSTENYINSENPIKELYDESIEYALHLISIDNILDDNPKYVYDNLSSDIDMIEKFTTNPELLTENININSHFFKNKNTKIAYLKLNKSQQDDIDKVKENENRSFLTIGEMEKIHKYGKPIFFDEWLYRFMQDKDNDAMVGEFGDDIANQRYFKTLMQEYRSITPEERYQVNLFDKNKNGLIDDGELAIASQTSEADIILLNAFTLISISTAETTETTEEDNNPIQDPKNDSDSTSDDGKYNSIFYTQNSTRNAYIKLTDDQKIELDNMDTDNDGILSIEEVIASGLFELPIIRHIDWIYPFMYDEDNDGLINIKNQDNDYSDYSDDDNKEKPIIAPDDDSAEKAIIATDDDSTEKPITATDDDIKDAIKLLEIDNTDEDDSVFLKNNLTRQAYLLLSDEQKKELNLINTDNKYPLTIEEVRNCGKFQFPIKKYIDWIYPFMIDRNNDGEIGEYNTEDGLTEYKNNNNPSSYNKGNNNISQISYVKPANVDKVVFTQSQPVKNQVQISQVPDKTVSEDTSHNYVSAASNVHTGIKSLKAILILVNLSVISLIKFKDL